MFTLQSIELAKRNKNCSTLFPGASTHFSKENISRVLLGELIISIFFSFPLKFCFPAKKKLS